MKPPVDVSVVIATRNRAARLRDQLDSLAAQTLKPESYEVVVADDASTDDTPRLLADEARRGRLRLRVLRHDVPAGPGHGRNAAWRAATGGLIAFTDDDCVADPGWLEAGLRSWDGDPDRFVQGATHPRSDEWDDMGLCSYTMDVRELTTDFPTCNMFYPRELLERVGGFDADSFPGAQGEDTDLAWRAKALGAKPVFEPAARVEHAVVSMGPLGFLRRAASWGNAMLLCVRHPEFRRRRLYYRVFWNWQHYLLLRLVIAAFLPWRLWAWPLKVWLGAPYVRYRLPHPRHQRPSLLAVLWFVVADTVTSLGVLRGALRSKTIVL